MNVNTKFICNLPTIRHVFLQLTKELSVPIKSPPTVNEFLIMVVVMIIKVNLHYTANPNPIRLTGNSL